MFLFTQLIFIACRTTKPTTTEEILDTAEDRVVSDLDGDGYLSDEDCDDNNATVHPNASEICDGIDNNCNGEIDEGVLLTFFIDSDADGFGAPTQTVEACQQTEGTVPNDNDCDDNDASAFPSAEEICDAVDNNCNGEIDEGVLLTQYRDLDEDGFGDPTTAIETCSLDAGFVLNDQDCDDTDATIYPNASEVCDSVDNNCNGLIDDDDSGVSGRTAYYKDADNDGFGDPAEGELFCTPPIDYIDNNLDCDDIDTTIHPNASEICDSVDNDCDGMIDDQDPDIQDASLYYIDQDLDGFGDPNTTTLLCYPTVGWSANNSDCDDNQSLAYTGATEVCDTVDNDCNGMIDDQDPNIDPSSQSVYYIDQDLDGFGDPNQPILQCLQGTHSLSNDDCDDTDPALNPNTLWYVDQDGDGFGSPNGSLQICTQPIGYTNNNQDCDDTDSNRTPNTAWYPDIDNDGFGDGSFSTPLAVQCTTVTGSQPNNDDCDDSDPTIYPNATLGCDDTDHNCDGLIDNDNDGDGWSDITCGGSDCNDNDDTVYDSSGLVAECSVLDCDDLFTQDPTLSDGVYWIDPDGNGAFEAYCLYDANTQQGWTMIMRAIGTDIPYGSSVWTSTDLSDASNWSLSQTGSSKYESFNRVPFTQIRTASPTDFSNGYTETFSVGYASALDLFGNTGFSLGTSTVSISYFLGLVTDGYYTPYGCNQYQDYGFNQQDYLGTGFINGGSYCDWNGGARWGVRYNASHSGTGNHQGIGWGNYTTIGYAPQNISQIMWVH